MTDDLQGRSAPDAYGGRPIETNFDRAVRRVEYCLTYDKCDPREFFANEMDGPRIPNAYGEGMAPGEWFDGAAPSREDPEMTEEDWYAHFAKMAVNEAVHEALEWLKVDGKCWLNPHGDRESEIFRLVNRLCANLAKLAAEGPELPR